MNIKSFQCLSKRPLKLFTDEALTLGTWQTIPVFNNSLAKVVMSNWATASQSR